MIAYLKEKSLHLALTKKDICRRIEMFYTNIQSTVIVNGQLSKWFPIYVGAVDRVVQFLPIYLFFA